MIVIDGVSYNIGIQSVQRQAELRNRLDVVTEDGARHIQRLGVYYHWTVTFAPAFVSNELYRDFYNVITSPQVSHEVVIREGNTYNYSFTATFSDINDNLVSITPSSAYWDSLVVQFSAIAPSRV